MKFSVDRELVKSVVSLASVIEARDPYTGGHTWRVSQYAVKLAQKLGLTSDEIFIVNLGGLVHDLGKIGINDAILLKPDKLTDEEYEIMKKHPEIGNELVNSHPLFPILADAINGHHERIDGKGYPHQFSNNEISVIGRITAIADAFDAMTSTRPYRKGMPKEKAFNILLEEKGKQFDAHMVDLFVELGNSGELDHILGHCGDEKLMMSCETCGPIIAPENNLNAGDHITCPACHGDYILTYVEGKENLEFTGSLIQTLVPKVDNATVNAFIKPLPSSLDLTWNL